MSGKIRIGVFGARRGAGLADILARHPDAELVALCDQDAAPLEQARQQAERHGCRPECYASFDAFFQHDLDAVVLANYATEHAPYAIRLLESGRHVCSELRPVRLSAYESPNANKRRVGGRSADGAVVACQMSNGATASILPWVNYKREPGMEWYAVYGRLGMMETDRWGETYGRVNVYVEDDTEVAARRAYAPRPPVSTELSRTVGAHGGADFYILHYFVEAILGRPGGQDIVDVYRAMDMSLPGLLGYRSIWEGNIPLEVPDLRDRAARDRWRHDHWSADPRLAGPGQPAFSCARGLVEAPESVYRRQAGQE